MLRTSVVIIGAGQAGLAVSKLLTDVGVDHAVLERGMVADSWQSRRWDSLRLLTPNWMSRLPGWCYGGPDPGGFMTASSVAGYLDAYASSFAAPVVANTEVLSVRCSGEGFVVRTGAGEWSARSVVIATGHCAEAAVPRFGRVLDPAIRQLTPDSYRNPSDVPDGRVLVVGASATGVQLADELAGAGRDVVLAVGRHTRMPRRYRGMDIMWWLDSLRLLDQTVAPGRAGAHEPSLQLVGSEVGREVDLASLVTRGVDLVGRVEGCDGAVLQVADDLLFNRAAADARLRDLLSRIDEHAAAVGLHAELEPPSRPVPFEPGARRVPTRLRLGEGGIRTVVWATGYRRRYPWLHVPVLDASGEVRQVAGRTPVRGLTVVGMGWQTRRNSTFLDGVRHDAALVVDHLVHDVLVGVASGGRDS